jgi:hypothetical protein
MAWMYKGYGMKPSKTGVTQKISFRFPLVFAVLFASRGFRFTLLKWGATDALSFITETPIKTSSPTSKTAASVRAVILSLLFNLTVTTIPTCNQRGAVWRRFSVVKEDDAFRLPYLNDNSFHAFSSSVKDWGTKEYTYG